MSRLEIPDNLLREVDPLSVRNFLEASGFVLSGKKKDEAEAYSIGKEFVILPLRQTSHEYSKMLLSLMEYVGQSMQISIDDVFGLIANPNSDIMRYIIESEDSRFGNLGADYIRTATYGLYRTFLTSARKVASIQKRPKINDSADAYVGSCRFGQTEYGSFVLKIFCPTIDFGIRAENAEPYFREVTRSVYDNFSFLAECDNVTEPEVLLPPTMSKEVAHSIKEMHPATPLMFSAGLSVRYSKLKDSSRKKEVIYTKEAVYKEFKFKSDLFEKAEKVYERLRKVEEFGRELLTGYITDLHKDPPIEKDFLKHEIHHKITMELKFGIGRRKVSTILVAAEYKKAIRWHDEGIEIKLDAIIDKRTKKWVVCDLHHLGPRDPNAEQLLF